MESEGFAHRRLPRLGTLSGEKCPAELPASLSATLFAFHLETEQNGREGEKDKASQGEMGEDGG